MATRGSARSKARNGSTMAGVTGVPVALLYTRISGAERQKEGLSLDAQLTACRRYAAAQGWILGAEFTDVMSGKRDDRPQYQALLADVRQRHAAGQPVVVVVSWLHRLGRKVLERVRCREELKALGVATHSALEGGEVTDLVANILASVAEEEIKQLSDRCREVHQHTAERGWRPVGRAPWGYRWRDATPDERRDGAPRKVLDVDDGPENDEARLPKERTPADAVRQLFTRVANGTPLNAAARWAADLPAMVRGGRNLGVFAVRDLLTAPVYIGRPDDGDDDVLARARGKWPALVDDATWTAVQARRASHAKLPHQATGKYLLTGLARCPACGGRMTPRGQTAYGYRYVCRATMDGARNGAQRSACAVTAKGPQIEAQVLDTVSETLDVLDRYQRAPVALQRAVRRAYDEHRMPAGMVDPASRRAQLEAAHNRARKRLGDAAVLLVDGSIDRAGYEALRERVEAELQETERALQALAQEHAPSAVLPPLDALLADAGGWVQMWRQTDDTAVRRDVLAALIERVTPRRVSRGQYTVAGGIDWTSAGKALADLAAQLPD